TGINAKIIIVIITAGNTINKFALNLSLSSTPCVLVAAIVVSEIKDKLSPNIAPPTTVPNTKGRLRPVCEASPTPIGATAVMVPIDVPIAKDKIQLTINNPGNTMLEGSMLKPKFTIELTAPISSATE